MFAKLSTLDVYFNFFAVIFFHFQEVCSSKELLENGQKWRTQLLFSRVEINKRYMCFHYFASIFSMLIEIRYAKGCNPDKICLGL